MRASLMSRQPISSFASAGVIQSGSRGHRGDDNLPAVVIEILRVGPERALLGHIFGSFDDRAVDPRNLFADVEFGFVRRNCVLLWKRTTPRPIVELFGCISASP